MTIETVGNHAQFDNRAHTPPPDEDNASVASNSAATNRMVSDCYQSAHRVSRIERSSMTRISSWKSSLRRRRAGLLLTGLACVGGSLGMGIAAPSLGLGEGS